MAAQLAIKDRVRLLAQAEEAAVREWGKPAFDRLGPRLQRALLCEAVLSLVDAQDESIDPVRIRELVAEGYAWAMAQGDD